MFAWPWKKKVVRYESTGDIAPVDLDWLDQYFREHEGIRQPDWEAIYTHLEKGISVELEDEFWNDLARAWMRRVTDDLTGDYCRTESENFILISPKNLSFSVSLVAYLERCRKRLLSIAKGILKHDGDFKFVVIAFDSIDAYYDYVSYFGPVDGEFGLTSGMFIDQGYGHFVFFADEMDQIEPIAVHEMTHAFLRHLPIPLWLNEGMAVNMESMITGIVPDRVDSSAYQDHLTYWPDGKIQEFWNGNAFSRADEGQRLSYQLAQVLVTNLSKNYSSFIEFVNHAQHGDGGEAACLQSFGIGVGDAAAGFLGEGDWSPSFLDQNDESTNREAKNSLEVKGSEHFSTDGHSRYLRLKI